MNEWTGKEENKERHQWGVVQSGGWNSVYTLQSLVDEVPHVHMQAKELLVHVKDLAVHVRVWWTVETPGLSRMHKSSSHQTCEVGHYIKKRRKKKKKKKKNTGRVCVGGGGGGEKKRGVGGKRGRGGGRRGGGGGGRQTERQKEQQ